MRFCSAMILQIILLISYGFLLHQANFSKKMFYLGGALLLLPVSVTYGRIVLYHCYYIPHIALSFFLVGLSLDYAKPVNWRNWCPYIRLAVLLLFSFLGGLGGVRQLMITHAPLLLCIVIFYFIEDAAQNDTAKSSFLLPVNFQFLAAVILSALFSFVGLKINTNILGRHYMFEQQATYLLSMIEATDLNDVMYGFFHHFGFRKNVVMLSLTGLLSISGLFVGCYCIILSIRQFVSHTPSDDIRKSIVQTFFLCVTAVTLLLFFITGGAQAYRHVLYLVFSLPWAIILFVSEIIKLSPKVHLLRTEKLFPILALVLLLANGYANITYFNGSHLFEQEYEGLSFNEIDKKDNMSNVTGFLLDNGYDIGYATFWNSNVLTEITDSKIRMITVKLYPNDGKIIYDNWLTLWALRNEDSEKPFVLLKESEIPRLELSQVYPYCSLAYAEDGYYVFDILQEDSFKSVLDAATPAAK